MGMSSICPSADALMAVFDLFPVSDPSRVAQMRMHARVDELAAKAVADIQTEARAARAWINRRAGQRLRRMGERLQEGR